MARKQAVGLAFALLVAVGCGGGSAGGGSSSGGSSSSSGASSSGGSAASSGGSSSGSSGSSSGISSDWTLSNGANPEDLVEAVTFTYTVTVNFTSGKISYTDPSSLATATADLPASGSKVVALNAAAANPATITFARDAYGHTFTAAMPTGEYLRLVLSGAYTGSLTLAGNRKMGLSLAGLAIDSADGPALNIQSSKRTFVVLEDGTSSALNDSGASASTPWSARTLADGTTAMDLKGTFFSEGPLVFSAGTAGTGTLTVKGLRKAALCSDAHVRVRGGTLTLNATGVSAADGKDGIHANEAFVMDGGAVTVKATYGDGVQVEGKEDATQPLGFVAINGGTLTVSSYDHGLRASFDATDTTSVATTTTADDPDPFLVINGGTVTVTTTGPGADAIRAQSWLTVNGGTVSAATTGSGKAKAIQAKSAITVNDGALTLSTASTAAEGIKSTLGSVTVNGGALEIAAGEDGIAAETGIAIHGGQIYVHSGAGDTDGLDSNRAMTIDGGLLVVVGSGNAPGDALDGTSITVTGGTFVTVGGVGVAGGPFGDATVTATVDAVKLTFSSSTWTSSTSGKMLVVGSTADPLLAYQLPSLSTNQGIVVMFRHPGLASGTSYAISTGTGTATGRAFHGFYVGDATTVAGTWTSRGTFTATGGLVTKSF